MDAVIEINGDKDFQTCDLFNNDTQIQKGKKKDIPILLFKIVRKYIWKVLYK